MKTALMRQTHENATLIFICLEGMRKTLFSSSYKNYLQNLEDDKMLEKIRNKVKEIKLDSITYKNDEKIVFSAYLDKIRMEKLLAEQSSKSKINRSMDIKKLISKINESGNMRATTSHFNLITKTINDNKIELPDIQNSNAAKPLNNFKNEMHKSSSSILNTN